MSYRLHVLWPSYLTIKIRWFSTVTHLAALSCLRNFYINHMTKCIWRLIMMFSIIVMLIVALAIGAPARAPQLLGYESTLYMPETGEWQPITRIRYMICLWEPVFGSLESLRYVAFDIVFSVWFLIFGFVTRTLKLKRGLFTCIILSRRKSRETLARFAEGRDFFLCRLLGRKVYTLTISKPLIAIRLFGRLYLELFTSLLAEVCTEPCELHSVWCPWNGH